MKEPLIKRLVDDFLRMFPHATRAEIIDLRARLAGFDLQELELLCSQLPEVLDA